jgi:hypothetical protein
LSISWAPRDRQVMTRNMPPRDTEEGIDAFLEKRPPPWE